MNFLIIIFSVQVLAIILHFIKLISKPLMISLIRFSYAPFLIFSGFVKLIDPLGFSYKLQEYFEVFGFDWLIPLSLFLSISIILFEIFLAIFLIFGIHVKRVMWGNLILMLCFTFLTFFSAYFNKVTDCGCFGDFMKLDPWHSFIKDVYLLFISLILFFHQSQINRLLSSLKTTKTLLIIQFVVFVSIPLHALSYLPFIDFRPYRIGSNITEGMKTCDELNDPKKPCQEEAVLYMVENKKTGKKSEMLSTEYQKKYKEYTYISAGETITLTKGYEPPIHDFDIIDPVNGFNVTGKILSMKKVLLVVCYDIEKTTIDAHQKINQILGDTVKKYDLPIYGLSSSSIEEIKNKLSVSELLYPYFLVDQTTLKTMIRANPGIFLLEKGVVTQKWHWRNLPNDLSITQH